MVKICENNTCRSTRVSRKLPSDIHSVVYFQILQSTVNIKGFLLEITAGKSPPLVCTAAKGKSIDGSKNSSLYNTLTTLCLK